VLTSRWTKAAVFLVSLAPLALLLRAAYTDELGPNPLEFITRATGDWTLRFLLIALAVTPLRKLLRLPDLIRFRRMLGLFAFFYGCLHLLTYLWFDRIFEFAGIWEDISKRPYITIGFTSWALMLPLAVTSTAGWIRRLGGRRDSLLLVGEVRRAPAAALRRNPGGAAGAARRGEVRGGAGEPRRGPGVVAAMI
jgi:sulfoxide reductase heme-binding subunit YedZ